MVSLLIIHDAVRSGSGICQKNALLTWVDSMGFHDPSFSIEWGSVCWDAWLGRNVLTLHTKMFTVACRKLYFDDIQMY